MNHPIRNFCIIAHIDHGKSTLADRFLELTGTVSKRDMKSQLLDSMDLERERGITIKLTPVRMMYEHVAHNTYHIPENIHDTLICDTGYMLRHQKYVLNLIDTPGHVDFTYEVSRSLAAVEGAILLVDATQGVQAQTIGNLYLALEQNLTIIPVVNKIDLPSADVAKTKAELMHLIGCKEEEILAVSGRTGEGVPELLEAIVERVPAPHPNPLPQGERELQKYPTPLMGGDKGGGVSLRALIFDSIYDTYRGVVAYVRVFDGEIKKGEKIIFMATKAQSEALEVGFFKPKFVPSDSLGAGEIGYIVTGLKDIAGCRDGDTITGYTLHATSYTVEPLPGYKEVKPMVFAGIFPKVGD